MIQGSTRDKARVTNQEGEPRFTWVNIRIKLFYHNFKTRLGGWPGQGLNHGSGVLKLNLGVDSVQDSCQRLEGSSQMTQKIFKKINGFLTRVLSRVDLGFWPYQVESIIPLFFFKLKLVQTVGQPVKLVLIL